MQVTAFERYIPLTIQYIQRLFIPSVCRNDRSRTAF